MSINDFKLEKQIGSGTFGDVYKAYNKHSGMKVAIKRVKKKVLYENGKYLLNAFYREIECMKKCACENSIKFIKEFQTENNYNIIMELCDTDLLCHLYERKEPFTVDDIRDTFSQLNNAFRKMSENNIIHRDLKLGNILIKFIDESKTKFIPKLSDYGFSKELNNYNFSSNTHLGTPATMAPEIMMNYPYNDKSDLWSVGVMMYQLYYREVPYEGNSEKEILKKIQSNYPYKQPDDPNFRDIINKLLVVNVQNRLSWNEYFKHPFFNNSNIYHENITPPQYDLFNSFSSLEKNFSLTKANINELEIGYICNSQVFDNNNNFFIQGNIYGTNNNEGFFGKSESVFINNNINNPNYFDIKENYENKIQLINKGKEINDNEYQIITKSCIEVKDNNNIYPLSQHCADKIRNQLNGQWFVLVYTEEDTNYDYFSSMLKDERYVIFKYKNNLFHICQIK